MSGLWGEMRMGSVHWNRCFSLAAPSPSVPSGHGGVGLLGAIDGVGKPVVGRDMVELRRGLVVLAGPSLAAVHADRRSAIAAFDHPIGVGRINPQAVVVTVRHG